MLQWRVLLLAVVSVLLLLGGLAVLIVPSPHEGPVLYQVSDQYVLRSLDVVGLVLLGLGAAAAWSAGVLWQQEMYAS